MTLKYILYIYHMEKNAINLSLIGLEQPMETDADESSGDSFSSFQFVYPLSMGNF